MSRQSEKIKKVFKETLQNGVVIEEGISPRDIIDLCEKDNKLYSYKDMFIAPTMSRIGDSDCMRIIFALREISGGRVQNVERVINLVKDLETVLIYLDDCNQTKDNGFIYFDVTKIIEEFE